MFQQPVRTLTAAMVTPRSTIPELAAICLGNMLGGLGMVVIKLWVAAAINGKVLSTSTSGWIATAELLSTGVAVLGASALTRGQSAKQLAIGAALAMIGANALSMTGSVQLIVMGRVASGIGAGVLLAVVFRLAARRRDAQRVLAVMQLVAVAFVAAAFTLAPWLIDRFGTAGIFAMLAVLGVPTVTAIWLGVSNGPTLFRSDGSSTVLGSRAAPLLGCCALALMYVSQNSFDTYLFLLARKLGVGVHTLSTVLAIGTPITLVGSLIAHRLGERVGLLLPLVAGLGLLALATSILLTTTSALFFCGLLVVTGPLSQFAFPYAVAVIGRLDVTGRFVGMSPAFIMLGSAAGPSVGGALVSWGAFRTLAVVATACIVLSIGLFRAALWLVDDELGDIRI